MKNARNGAVLNGLVVALGLAAWAAGRPAHAQVADADAASLAMGDNYTALARGRDAVAWNPANLALPGAPAYSLALLPLRLHAGQSPVGMTDLLEIDGEPPASIREAWLERIVAAGGQRGTFGAEVTGVSLGIGRVGFQVSTTVAGVVDLGPDAARILLRGGDAVPGEPRNYDLAGSSLHAAVTSTVALSYAHPLELRPGFIPVADQRLSIGATVKHTVGSALVDARGHGVVTTGDPAEAGLAFPLIHTDADAGLNHGSGFGIDLGVAWQGAGLSVGVVVRNLLNTFGWNEAALRYRPGHALIDGDAGDPAVGSEPVARAPAAVRAHAASTVTRLTYAPAIALGAALALPELTLSADVRHRFGDGMEADPVTHAGIGAEFRLRPWLPLRAGVAALSGGYRVAGGFGLELRGFRIGVAASHRKSDLGRDATAMVSLSFAAR